MVTTQHQADNRIRDDPLVVLLPGVITTGTLLVAFTLLAAGFEDFWIIFPLGFGGVLPLSIGYSIYRHATSRQTDPIKETNVNSGFDEDDSLDMLKQQYARGKLSEAEFEHRVEQLLSPETATHQQESTGQTVQ